MTSSDQISAAPTGSRVGLVALLVSEAISSSGNALTRVALPWFVLETTGSATRVGLTSGVAFVALVVAGFLGGPIVDRLGFKRAAIMADLGSGSAVVAIPLLYVFVGLSFWQLLVLVAIATLFGIPGLTAHIGLVPALADAAGMPRERANAASQAVGHLTNLLGPAAAGVLLAVLETQNVLWLDAASFALSAVILATALPTPYGRTRQAARAADTITGNDTGRLHYADELAEGLRVIWRDRVIRAIATASVVINFAYVPVLTVALVVYAEQIFDDPVALGLMLSGFGAGALVGSVLYGGFGHRLPRRATMAAAHGLLSMSTLALIAISSLSASVVLLFLAGFALGPGNPIIYTVTQERVPARLLGRVIGSQIALSNAAVPVGALLTGHALDVFGLRLVLVFAAAVIAVVALYVALNPSLGGMERSEVIL